MNQSEFVANARNRGQARENAYVQVTICLGLALIEKVARATQQKISSDKIKNTGQ